MWSERKKLNREVKSERAEDEPSIIEFDITENEAGTATDGILAALQRRLHKPTGRLKGHGRRYLAEGYEFQAAE